MKPRMSCLVTRPPIPDPEICEMSTLCSFAILRTSGEDLCLSPSAAIDAEGAAATGAAGGLGRRTPEALVVDGGGGVSIVAPGTPVASAASETFVLLAPDDPFAPVAAGAATSPAAPMVATTLLTGTVSPSFTEIAVSTPAAGDGISAST